MGKRSERLEARLVLAAPHPFDLSTLNGTNGFRLDGIDAGDQSGRSVSSAGDVNGDGFDDLLIGAYRGDPNGDSNAGESYVVFGKSSGFASALDLSTLNGMTGFRLDGIDAGDFSGKSVSSAGDVNGDGFDDLLIGAIGGAPNGNGNAGETYVVFGKSSGFGVAMDLATLDGTTGFRLDGIDAYDRSGCSVSSAGDVNGDGFDDLLIGANGADPNADSNAGETYVVFGKSSGFPAALNLATLDGATGFRLDGIDVDDYSGRSVSNAGDVNGDGFDDLLIGAFGGDPNSIRYAGESYVVFGKSTGFAAAIDLSALDGTNGFRLDGIDAFDDSGKSVASAGDVNGDGFNDLLIAAMYGDPNGHFGAGECYLVFGKPSGFTAALDLSTLNGTNGFRLDGIDAYDFSFRSVSTAGDVNGDGFDDILLGADRADGAANLKVSAGESYVVFGRNFTGGNTAPAISEIRSLRTNRNTATAPIALTVSDAETPAGQLNVTPTSSNQTLVPNGNIVLGGSGANRTVTVTPAAGQTGTATITLTVTDGLISQIERFVLTVVEGPPTIDLSQRHDIVDAIRTNDRAAWSSVTGNIGVVGETDSWFFTVTGTERVGLFIDIDARDVQIPLVASTLDSEISIEQLLGNGSIIAVPNATNDNGFDFKGFPLPDSTALSISDLGFKDSSLYVELGPGNYFVNVRGKNNSIGNYELRMLADSTFNATVPALNSPQPNAPHTLLLDFNGHSSTTDFFAQKVPVPLIPQYAASEFNLDGQAGFSPAERLAIYNIWKVVAADFAEFNFGVNVTTVEPANAATDRRLHRHVVTSSRPMTDLRFNVTETDFDFGVAPLNGFVADDLGSHVAFTFAANFDRGTAPWTTDFDAGISGRIMADAYEMGDTTSHEFAHTLGLRHYNEQPANVIPNRPAGSADTITEAIMAQPKSGLRPARWVTGNAWNDETQTTVAQNDVSLIASSLGSPTSLIVNLTGTESLSAARVGTNVEVRINNTIAPAYQQVASAVTEVGVRGGTGRNVIDLSQVTRANFANAGVIVFAGDGDDVVTGTELADSILGDAGNDVLVGGAGGDNLTGGEGDDTLATLGAQFQKLAGGNGEDTLRLDGSGIALDLTSLADDKLTDIEVINISGSGNNTLTLNQLEVLNLSSTSNTLLVRLNSGDTVNKGSGWTQVANETIAGDVFAVFTQGAAILKVQVVETIAPSALSFTRKTPTTPTTNADTLVFVVTFSEDVTGVAAADFAVTGTTGTITVTQLTPSTYDVTISGGNLASLNGTVGLNFNAPSIMDLAGNALPNTEPATDQTYVVDNSSPSTSSFTRKTPSTPTTNADTLVFLVTFSEDVTGVAAADFAVTGTTGTITVTPLTPSTYDVTISGGNLASLNGTVGLNFNAPSIMDLAGNALPNAEPATDQTYVVDNTAPSTASFTRKTPTTPTTNADTLVFLATFSEDVSGVAAADFAVTGTTGTITVTQLTPSTYDVTISGGNLASLNGTVGLNFNAPSIMDLAGNALPNAEPATDQTYVVDNTAPSTASFTRKTPTTPTTNADTLVFLATFSEDVSGVAAADFAVTGTTGTITVTQLTPSTYDVTISGGNLASLNGTVGLNFNAPSIMDLAGNALPSSEPATDQTFAVDNTAPSTTSFARKTPTTSPTNADTLVFLATFNEDVTGVAAADFAVTGTTGTITVTPLTARSYDITVSGGNLASLNGTVGLNLKVPSIMDLAGNSLPTTEPSTDETYVVTNNAPSLTSFTRQTPTASPTNLDTLVFRATFSTAVNNVNTADFTVNGTTTATVATVTSVSGSVFDVTVSGGNLANFNGSVGLNLSVAQNITDALGNALPSAEPATDESYAVDNVAPSVTSFTRKTPTTLPTNADTLVFLATFSEDVTGVAAADFAVTGTTGAITVTQLTPSTYDVTISGGNLASLNGPVGLNFNAPSITDLAGNALPNTEPATDQTFAVDNTAPSTMSFNRTNPTTSPTSVDTLIFLATFSEDVTGVATADFAVTGTTGTITVTQLTPSTYAVTISGGNLASLNGTVGLNFNAPSIMDLAGNALPNTEPATDQTFAVDNTAPSTVSFTRKTPTTSPTNADTLVFLATFSEDVSGVAPADFAVTGTTGTITVTQLTPSTYDVTISGGNLASLNGTVGLNLNSPSIMDLAGNALPNNEPATDQTYVVANTIGISLRGLNGVEISNGDTSPSETDGTSFGSVLQNSATVLRTFTVTNTGSATLTLDGGVSVSGHSRFAVTESLAPSLEVGQSDTFTISMLTDQSGSFETDVRFNMNAAPGSFGFGISGTVIAIPQLSLTITPTSFSENGGSATGTVTRNSPTTSSLTVTLLSGDTSEATVPSSVTILAGQASATFAVTAINDGDSDGTQTATITATAMGHTAGTSLISVTDDERRTTIDLAALVAGQGTTIFGADAFDQIGRSVSNAGDVNGDGFDDLLIGAYRADGSGNGKSYAGDSYVIFGGASLPATLDLASLGLAGITIFGADANDRSGSSVSSAGDVNGDGFDDLLIGATWADASRNAKSYAGDSYVIFGAASLPTTIDLASLDAAGITFFGVDANDRSGNVVSSAGDVNGDGFDDLLIGAYNANGSENRKGAAGESYVIFGGAPRPTTIDLASLGAAGITIFGADANDSSALSVSSAGDVNGDGFDDLLIGAYRADASGNAKLEAGESYVIFGRTSLPATIDLASLGSAGITIFGADANDQSGSSVSSAGDVNGDGFDDLLIGASTADASGNGKSNAGESYMIFGSASLPATLDLASLGVAGITIVGADVGDFSGFSVSSAGDVNGDGFDDLLIGAPNADASGDPSLFPGQSYIIFGRASLPAVLDLDSLGEAGITIFGADVLDSSGASVSRAGDVNGDGFDDLLIGAPNADASENGKAQAGESYVIFGGDFTRAVTHAGTAGSEMLTGNAAANVLVGGRGNDTLIGNGGSDVLEGGEGADTFGISDVAFRRIGGGNGSDTLRLDGSGISLNLTTIADNRLTDIEVINITGSGNNTLTLNLREVLNLSSTSNTLRVARNAGDTVNIGSGWTQQANQALGADSYEVFTQGAATLLVMDPPAPVTASVLAGVLTINVSQFSAADVRVTLNTGTNQFAVTSLVEGVTTTFNFAAASVTNGVRANLGAQADRFDASGISLPMTVLGGDGNDTILSGSSNDSLDGGAGNDSLDGGLGDDVLTGGLDADILTGGTGTDTLRETADFDMTLTSTALVFSVNGQTATTDVLSGFEVANLTGGAGANVINASGFVPGSGLIVTLTGGGGADVISGTNGKDLIVANSTVGVTVSGGSGNDTITTGSGNDSIVGVAGNDSISTGAGRDTVNGGTGNDTIDGGLGNDSLNGQDDNDSLIGGDNDDRLSGGTGNDVLDGGVGADILKGDDGADILNGGAGADNLQGGKDNDRLSGGDDADSLDGAFGNDTLEGGNGDDTLRGNVGVDDVDGNAGNDRLTEGFGTETAAMTVVITGLQMVNSAYGNETSRGVELFVINGGAENDKLDARSSSIKVQFRSVAGADTLLGSALADLLSGGDGDDVLSGGAGTDVIDGGLGIDFFYEKANSNFTVSSLQVVSTVTGTETLVGIERIALVGGDGNNVLDATSSNLPVILVGGKGNDTLRGSNFNDVLIGGSRTATPLTPGGDGTDSLTGGAGTDTYDNDPLDTRPTLEPNETVIENVFAGLPSWLDLI